MKCKDCPSCMRGYFGSKPNDYFCVGVKHPFLISNIDDECMKDENKHTAKLDQLYYIENVGCDDETCGLARISDDDFPKFKTFIENLNKNSTYGCMPKIYVYKIVEGLIKNYEGDQTESGRILHLDGQMYVLATSSLRTYKDGEVVLVEGAEEVI